MFFAAQPKGARRYLAFNVIIIYNGYMFKDNLRFYRIKKGMTQKELASKLFVTRQSVSKWEQGINEPDIDTLKKLCSVLEINLEALLSDRPNENSGFNLNKTFLLYNFIFVCFCVFSVLILLRFLPEKIPAHFTHGQVDRYGKKYEILLHLITFLVIEVLDLSFFLVCKRNREKRSAIVLHTVISVFAVAYEVFVLAIHSQSISSEYLPSFAVCVTLAFFLSLFAAMSPSITPPNGVFGLRTSLTLENSVVWKKINGFASIFLVATTLPVLAVNMIFMSKWAFLSLLLYILPITAVAIYHRKLRTH